MGKEGTEKRAKGRQREQIGLSEDKRVNREEKNRESMESV